MTHTDTAPADPADQRAAEEARRLAALPESLLAQLVKGSPDALDAIGDHRPASAACRVVADSLGPSAPAEGVRYCDVKPLLQRLTAMIDGWPPAPSATLAELAAVSQETRRLTQAADHYDVGAALDTAVAEFGRVWSGSNGPA